MKKFPALAVCTCLVLGACSLETSPLVSDDGLESSSSLSSESVEFEKNSQKSNVLDAITEIHIDVPANWKKTEAQTEGPYVVIKLTSPNYRETHNDTMCGETEGAEIVVTATNLKEGMATIDDILKGESDSEAIISDVKKVSVDNNPAVEYVWSWECSPRLITETDYNGVRYSIYLSDADILTEYSDQYYGIIDSIRFAVDTSS